MSKIISIFSGHDSNITFYNSATKKYHIIEIERLIKSRYFRITVDNSEEEIFKIFSECKIIAENYWGFDSCDEIIFIEQCYPTRKVATEIWNPKTTKSLNTSHHSSHAAS